ncbi:MAG: Peyers patch-specific virulence factor GipA [uncultured bacterium]|nr:MAG: Peyers patch-specific virulence factor GipA [uncultured bacterium]
MKNIKQPFVKGEVKKFVKGFKFPIYPNESQKELLGQTFGCCRYIWNRALSEVKTEFDYYNAHKDLITITPTINPNVTGYGLVNRLISYKRDPNCIWLNDVSSVALQQNMLHLGTAFSTFFKNRKGFPKFKKMQNKQSFTLMKNSFRFKEEKFYIANCKDSLIIDFTRKLPSEPSSAVISKTASGNYYISFVCEYFPIATIGSGVIGIDLGLKDFLVTSDGIKVPNPKNTKKYSKQLKRKQQSLSRKQKASKNREKARVVVAKQYERISNCRNDFQHKLSRNLVNENQVIGLEKLVVKNMVKNHKLAKSISDVAWSNFTNKLNYKSMETQNCSLVYMDSYFPSTNVCNLDGYKLPIKLKLSERSWICPQCKTMHDRDINAAINIRNEAILTLHAFKVPEHACVRVLANSLH